MAGEYQPWVRDCKSKKNLRTGHHGFLFGRGGYLAGDELPVDKLREGDVGRGITLCLVAGGHGVKPEKMVVILSPTSQDGRSAVFSVVVDTICPSIYNGFWLFSSTLKATILAMRSSGSA